MAKNAENTAGDLAAELAALRHDIDRLAKTIGAQLQHRAKEAGLDVVEAANDAQDKVADASADVQERICAAGSEIEAYVKRNPITAALVAMGVGVALGLMTRSRS